MRTGADVAKWTKVGARRAVIVGVIAVLGVIVVGGGFALAYRQSHRTATEYAFDAPSALIGGGWACYGCRTVDGFDLTDRAAGVTAELPQDPTFRGVVITSDALPDGLRNVRVMPDGYYLEFTDGTVRFVADEAPWVALVPELEPEWIGYLIREGVINPA
jgi:hypothetical protein